MATKYKNILQYEIFSVSLPRNFGYEATGNMKTILILGGYGFLGTNIMKYIDAHYASMYRVIVFDKFERHLGGVKFNCVTKTYAGDFSDKDLLERIFTENTIDLVIHALSTTVPVDSLNARFDVESNLLPTLDILNLMVKHKVLNIVYLSSGGAIYGNAAHHAHKETDDVFPVSSYGVVKLAIEKYLMQYSELYGLQPLIIRLSNPYGPYHYSMKQGVCNVAMTTALQQKSMTIWGDGTGSKDYIYVEDYVRILFLLLEKHVCGEVVNIGSGDLHTVNEIVEMIRTFVPNFRWEHADKQQFDVNHFELDTSKLKSLIGAFDFTSFAEGMQRTYEWTKTICD